MNDRPREHSTGRTRRCHWLVAVGVATGVIGVSTAAALDVPLPTTSTLQSGAAPQASATATASTRTGQPTTVSSSTTTSSRVDWNATLGSRDLRMGMAGSDVKHLQNVLRRKGQRLTPDGVFGRQTRGAVIRVQQRLKMKRTGIANAAFVKRLGVTIRAPRSAAPAPPVDPSSGYPLAGPNAAKARYLKAFPLAGKHTYTNSWGAPRGQGGHEGTDIMAARIPVRAVTAGTITRANRVEKGLGGVYLWLEDDAGNDYYYAHMTSIAPGIKPGVRVKVGQELGIVGNSGDARYGATHLHLEIRPAGGRPINPYTDLIAVDPEPPTRK